MKQFVDIRAFDLKQWAILASLLALSVCFHVFTHELGHFAFAHAFGCKKIILHHVSVETGDYPSTKRLDSLGEVLSAVPFEKMEEHPVYPEFSKEVVHQLYVPSFWIFSGGQLVNLLIGLVAAVLLGKRGSIDILGSFYQKLKFALAMALPQFLADFLSVLLLFLKNKPTKHKGDSMNMGYYFRHIFFEEQTYWDYFFVGLAGVIGLAGLYYLFWYLLKPTERATVWAAALVGIPLGAYLWQGPLGKFLLP